MILPVELPCYPTVTPMSLTCSRYTLGGFDLGHLILIFIIVGCLVFAIYWFWIWPCDGDTEHRARVTSRAGNEGRVISLGEHENPGGRGVSGEGVVLYAMELEPGLVVLQDQDGELFRILQECDSVKHQGSTTSGLPPGTSFPVHYIPSYTRAHVQTRPSAPQLPLDDQRTVSCHVQEDWRPLCVQSGAGY
ncbi:hypothetical protein BaRGS_00032596 [Batillaria attramentaria]|uniref:Uncharacterized protein n=1 Tax=Batillaria attramentaria TaxID=370345 RepID=A0ABD0JMQ1_9CAEN